MIRTTKTLVALWIVLLCAPLYAQDTIRFTTGLAVGGVHRYGREAIVQDQLAWQLFTGKLQQPSAGQTLYTDDENRPHRWESVEVDSSGRFRGEALSSGYLYLTYESEKEQPALLNVMGNSMMFVNGEPRSGDIYRDGWMYVPVLLKKGTNQILVRCSRFVRWQGIEARLVLLQQPVTIHTGDLTLPHILAGSTSDLLWGGVVVSNATNKTLRNLTLTSTLEGKSAVTRLPDIPPLTIRKVGFKFDPSNAGTVGKHNCQLQLKQGQKTLYQEQVTVETMNPSSQHSYTFISEIDGSVQYFAVTPQTGGPKEGSALFLSVHGAGVEAIGQARAYDSKDWGTLVAPTNRRPRGFNWEDWGRLDALEVLNLAVKKFSPNPMRIYLTGHSMGGHGTWYLGATYPDKWAAIAPCAGYPTLTGYGSADGQIPQKGRNEMEEILLRASNPSNVIELAKNYKSFGVYIFHGDSDRVVSVDYARQMRKVLADFHPDFAYYEYPGGSHWFGDESVDWPPLFEYFRQHTNKRDSAVDVIDFTTANPGISSTYRWAAIVQQQHPLEYSKIRLNRDRKNNTIEGETENVALLKLDLTDLKGSGDVRITLDGDALTVPVNTDEVYLHKETRWEIGKQPTKTQKGPHRYGTFKDAFNHRMVFVYGTKGNTAERQWAYAKARYDAEVWYYRANGAVDVVADRDFDPKNYPNRGVILYGNAATNSAWNKLLSDCPIQFTRGSATVGTRKFEGEDIGGFFVWPRKDSDVASVGVVAGTGISGMRATEANQYFAGGSGFPDYFIFSADMLKVGAEGVKAAGFFGNDWSIAAKDGVVMR
nr:MAG: alpha/beta hydrolase [Bacteroidota bacterium]